MRRTVGRVVFYGMIASVLVIGAIATRSALTWADRPFAGFLVNERMVFGNVGQYHWTGTRAGLRYPDRIVAADGHPITSMKDLQRLVSERPVGAPITYSVLRSDRLIQVTVATMRFTWFDLLMTFGIMAVSGLIYFLIGTLVFVMKPDTKPSWIFLLACYLVSIFVITSFDVQSTHAGFIRLSLLGAAFFPAALTHLAMVFPDRRPFIESWAYLELIPYGCSVGLAVPLELLYPRPAFVKVYSWVLVYAITSGAAMLASTIHVYFTTRSTLARQRARVICIGAVLGLPIPVVAYYLSLFGGKLVTWTIQNNFLALPIVFFPGAVAYAIARHNLFDVDVYLKRAVGYGVMTVLVTVAYVGIQMSTRTMILQPIFGEFADRLYPFVFAILIVWFFNPALRRVQAMVDRIWFRSESDYKQTVIDISSALRSMLDRGAIMRKVARTVKDGMFLDRAGVTVFGRDPDDDESLFVREVGASGAVEERGVPIARSDPLVALVRREGRLITLYELEEDPRWAAVREDCLRSCAELGLTMATPLLYRGEVRGVIVLGRRNSGRFYSRAEIDLLTTLADQAAVAIENARSHERVVHYAGELAASLRRIEILESMKTSLAKFVPRTVQEAIEQSPVSPALEKREADLSVLFADITGYTRLSATMELGRVNRLVECYFGVFLDEIVRFGGDVNETAGDGLMVIFQNADRRQHARAAVTAALAIQHRTREINATLEADVEPFAMHVGINSGSAWVGATKIEGAAGVRWTYTASGTTTNVAARLAALSEGGAVIISEETWRRVEGQFDVEDLGAQSLKNVPESVHAYRVVSERETVPDTHRAWHAATDGPQSTPAV